MHELSIAVQVVESAIRAIPSSLAGHKVERLTLDIGKMSSVTEASLRFCFEMASRGTFLESAELVINEIPATVECLTCSAGWTMTDPGFLCLKCGSPDIRLLSGRELMIRSMEIREKK